MSLIFLSTFCNAFYESYLSSVLTNKRLVKGVKKVLSINDCLTIPQNYCLN
jgi:hypothetical protein